MEDLNIFQLIAYGILGLMLLLIVCLVVFNQKSVGEALRGDDDRLQAEEVIMGIFVLMIIVFSVMDVLGVHISSQAWGSIDALGLYGSGGKAVKEFKQKSNDKGTGPHKPG